MAIRFTKKRILKQRALITTLKLDADLWWKKLAACGLTGKTNTRGDEELLWGRFYSIDVHPKTPLVGMLHATIVVQMFPEGKTVVGGWLGVMPGTKIDEDLSELKQVMDDSFDAFGVDVDFYRNLICEGDPEEIRREISPQTGLRWRQLLCPTCL